MNLYLLSLHAPVPKENKFTDYLIFRQALYKVLFQHLIGVAVAGAAESLPVAGPANLVLSLGDTVLVINNLDTEDRVELAATAAVAYIADKILITAAANLFVKHKRVSIKRTLYIIYKQATKKKKKKLKS